MRKLITLLELSIGTTFAVAVAAYVAQGFVAMAALAA